MYESALTPTAATAKPSRFGTFLRNKPVSASLLRDDDYSDLLDFTIKIDPDVWETVEEIENLDRIYSDIDYIGRTTPMNEGVLRAKKSSSSKRAEVRKWYKRNRSKLARARKKLARSAEGKRRNRKAKLMAKQKKNRHGKPLLKYPTANNHSNESFYNFVKEDREKVRPLPVREKPKYFMAEQSLTLGGFYFKENDLFILEGTTLIFEKDNKKYKIGNINTDIFQYLRRI